MSYKINKYSYDKAKQLGVEIKPSTKKNKKIDVFKEGNKVASIGSLGMKDFPKYLDEYGRDFAENRRRLYRIRHANTLNKVGSPSWYSANLLW